MKATAMDRYYPPTAQKSFEALPEELRKAFTWERMSGQQLNQKQRSAILNGEKFVTPVSEVPPEHIKHMLANEPEFREEWINEIRKALDEGDNAEAKRMLAFFE